MTVSGTHTTDWGIGLIDEKAGSSVKGFSHHSYKVIELCKENDIRFIFLASFSTHLTQPLDVSVFTPLKSAWRLDARLENI